jgi:hypothetical protein
MRARRFLLSRASVLLDSCACRQTFGRSTGLSSAMLPLASLLLSGRMGLGWRGGPRIVCYLVCLRAVRGACGSFGALRRRASKQQALDFCSRLGSFRRLSCFPLRLRHLTRDSAATDARLPRHSCPLEKRKFRATSCPATREIRCPVAPRSGRLACCGTEVLGVQARVVPRSPERPSSGAAQNPRLPYLPSPYVLWRLLSCRLSAGCFWLASCVVRLDGG